MASDLYRAEVPVADQSQAEREAALDRAIRQVLSKHSGLPLDDAEIRAASVPELNQILQFVQYRTVRAENARGAPWQQLRLEASFMPGRVDALVRELRLPRWSDERPLVMLALTHAVDQTGEGFEAARRSAALNWARFQVTDLAKQRGLRVEPLADDSNGNAPDQATIIELVGRGRPQQLLDEDDSDDTALWLGVLEQAGSRWQIRWALAGDELEERFDSAGNDIETSVREGLDRLVAVLAREQTISVTDQGIWQENLVVESVTDGRAYQRLVKLFRDLRMVDSARMLRMDDDRTEWQLELNASPTLLESSLDRVDWLLSSSAQGVYRYEAPQVEDK